MQYGYKYQQNTIVDRRRTLQILSKDKNYTGVFPTAPKQIDDY